MSDLLSSRLKDMASELVGDIALERAEWIDSTIRSHLPSWKVYVLECFPGLKPFLFIDIEILSETLIANFGVQITIKLNGKVIGQRKYTSEVRL